MDSLKSNYRAFKASPVGYAKDKPLVAVAFAIVIVLVVVAMIAIAFWLGGLIWGAFRGEGMCGGNTGQYAGGNRYYSGSHMPYAAGAMRGGAMRHHPAVSGFGGYGVPGTLSYGAGLQGMESMAAGFNEPGAILDHGLGLGPGMAAHEAMAGCQGGGACGGGGCYGYVSPIGLESQTSEFLQSGFVPACKCNQPPSYPAMAETQALAQLGAFANSPYGINRTQAMIDAGYDAAAGINDPTASNLLMNGHCAPSYHTM